MFYLYKKNNNLIKHFENKKIKFDVYEASTHAVGKALKSPKLLLIRFCLKTYKDCK